MNPQTPDKGRMVRIVDENGEEFPAVVIAVHSPKCVSVNAFTYAGARPLTSLMLYEEGVSPTLKRTWFWPPRAVGGQRSEVGGQRSEDGGQRSEVGGQRSEDGETAPGTGANAS